MRSNHAVLGTPYGELRTQSSGLLTEYETIQFSPHPCGAGSKPFTIYDLLLIIVSAFICVYLRLMKKQGDIRGKRSKNWAWFKNT